MADAVSWPAPADESTVWESVWTSDRGSRGIEVRVRWVMLWGKRVRVNADDLVYCHACRQFKTTVDLSQPFNGCPVGLPRREGIVYGPDMMPDEPNYRSAPLDFFRISW